MGKLIEKEGRSYKECGVVMLATDEASNIGLNSAHNHLFEWENNTAEIPTQKRQHLYITSDDEIKEGDWVLEANSNMPVKALKNWGEDDNKKYPLDKKIIATTDQTLEMKRDIVGGFETGIAFPQPSDKFIQAYIDAYNKGEKIEKVLVEYECPQCQDWGYVSQCRPNCNQKFIQPKLKDNNIIIKKVKDSWTREEVEISHLQMAVDITKHILCGGSFTTFDVSKWIKENL